MAPPFFVGESVEWNDAVDHISIQAFRRSYGDGPFVVKALIDKKEQGFLVIIDGESRPVHSKFLRKAA